MTDISEPIFWYCRTIFLVNNLEKALNFYTQSLGFEEQWIQTGSSAQVNRYGLEIILKVDHSQYGGGRVLVNLNLDLMARVREEFQRSNVTSSFKNDDWFAFVVQDLDKNELWFVDNSTMS
jgi:catechol 2,3-dioxygenase-like lactoylglutathione lyase family enzyme